MAGLHGLHPDQERVRQHPRAEHAGREPADARIAPGEMRDVCGRGRRIEQERNEVHGPYWPAGPK